MLSEDFDKKIIEAAERHHPPYDDRAWVKMRKLLDKHLPVEEEKKRRGVFFLLLFLLVGGGAAWFILGQPFGKKAEKPLTEQTTGTSRDTNPSGPADPEVPPGEAVTGNPGPADPAGENIQSKPVNDLPVTAEPGAVTIPGNKDKEAVTGQAGTIGNTGEPAQKTGNTRSSKPSVAGGRPVVIKKQSPASVSGDGKPGKVEKGIEPVTGPVKKNPDILPQPVKENKDAAINQPESVNPDPLNGKDKKTEPAAANLGNKEEPPVSTDPEAGKGTAKKKEDQQTPETETTKPPVRISKKKSSFFFSVSGGPDVCYTGQDKMGRVKLFGGGGVGYSYRDKFFLRTGFYTARKMYTSSPAEYHAPAAFYNYYPNLQKVEADCKVYEIPVTLGYYFRNKDRQRLFVSAGLSSYLMKRETYNFYYKYNPAGPVVNKQRTLYNRNEHYFSVINVSAGIQQKIGKRFSVVAEPYFKVPVGGVGFAKVNLISTGIQFSVTASPFGKSGKKKPGK